MNPHETEDAIILKQQIEAELDKCPSLEICNKIKNPAEKRFCIEYVYNHVVKFGMSISEGVGSLDAYLDEINL